MNSLFGRSPRKVCLSRWALMTILAVTAQAVAADADSDAAGRLPVPDAAAKEQATKMVRNLFAKEYAKRDPASRKALADTLLKQSLAGGDAPAVRFVLLSEARELAIQGNDRWKAMDAADELVKGFAVLGSAARQIHLDVLADGGRLAPVPGAVAGALSLSEEAIQNDDFDQAERAARLMQSGGKFATMVARTQVPRVEAARQLHVAAEQAAAKLKMNPDDREAKTAIGKYLCFVKGQWAQGLPLLVQSSDPVLRDAAKRDAALLAADGSDSPDLPASLVDAGDAWWSLTESHGKPTVSPDDAERRALFWYRRALPTLTGLRAVQTQKRIEQTTSMPFCSIRQFARTGHFFSGTADDFMAEQELARVWIHGKKKIEYTPVAGDMSPHLGKGVFITPDSAAPVGGSIKAGVPSRDDGIYYFEMLVMKDQSIRMQSVTMLAGQEAKWNVTRRGGDIVISVEKEGINPITLSAPAGAVIGYGLGTTVRWVGEQADLTICFD